MTHTTHALRNGLLTALALLAVGSAPAQAAQPRESVPDNWLYVTVTKGDERSSEMRGGLLVCDPARSQALAVRACEELNEADGDIARIPHKEASCPMIYAPVTASARGEWN